MLRRENFKDRRHTLTQVLTLRIAERSLNATKNTQTKPELQAAFVIKVLQRTGCLQALGLQLQLSTQVCYPKFL